MPKFDLEQLKAFRTHRQRFKKQADFIEDIIETNKIGLSAATIKSILHMAEQAKEDPNFKPPNRLQSTIDEVDKYLDLNKVDLARHRHSSRYTGVLLSGVNPGKPEHAPPNSLHAEVSVTNYKRGLMRAIKHANENPTSSKLPERVAFIAHTGQWLKPVVRSLIQHKHPVQIDAYLCDPQRPSLLDDGKPEAAEVLGTMEFLWSLPATLDLGKHTSPASLNIYCYRGAQTKAEALPQRMALFEGDLVCQTHGEKVNQASSRFDGHPGNRKGARRIKCPSEIEIALHGHDRFGTLVEEFNNLTTPGDKQLPGLDPEPLLTWNRAKGFGGRACGSQGTEVFDIDPMEMFPGRVGGYIEPPPSKHTPTGAPKSERDGRSAG